MAIEAKEEVKEKVVAPERAWPPSQGEWTYEDYLRLPEDRWRYEVIKGRLYMAPPPKEPHQYASIELSTAFHSFVKERGLGRVYAAPFEVVLPEAVVQPDIVFISAERVEEIVTPDGVRGAPDLVVEILSPINWLADRREKFELYRSSGVREYWIVDTKTPSIEVFVLREGEYELMGQWGVGEIARSEVLAGFEVAVDDICRRSEA